MRLVKCQPHRRAQLLLVLFTACSALAADSWGLRFEQKEKDGWESKPWLLSWRRGLGSRHSRRAQQRVTAAPDAAPTPDSWGLRFEKDEKDVAAPTAAPTDAPSAAPTDAPTLAADKVPDGPFLVEDELYELVRDEVLADLQKDILEQTGWSSTPPFNKTIHEVWQAEGGLWRAEREQKARAIVTGAEFMPETPGPTPASPSPAQPRTPKEAARRVKHAAVIDNALLLKERADLRRAGKHPAIAEEPERRRRRQQYRDAALDRLDAEFSAGGLWKPQPGVWPGGQAPTARPASADVTRHLGYVQNVAVDPRPGDRAGGHKRRAVVVRVQPPREGFWTFDSFGLHSDGHHRPWIGKEDAAESRLQAIAKAVATMPEYDLVVLMDVSRVRLVRLDWRAVPLRRALQRIMGRRRFFWFPWTERMLLRAFPALDYHLHRSPHAREGKGKGPDGKRAPGLWEGSKEGSTSDMMNYGWHVSWRELAMTWLEERGFWDRYELLWGLSNDLYAPSEISESRRQEAATHAKGQLRSRLWKRKKDLLKEKARPAARLWTMLQDVDAAQPPAVDVVGWAEPCAREALFWHTPAFAQMRSQLVAEGRQWQCLSEGLQRLSMRYLKVHAASIRSYVYQHGPAMVHPVALINRLNVQALAVASSPWTLLHLQNPKHDQLGMQIPKDQEEHHPISPLRGSHYILRRDQAHTWSSTEVGVGNATSSPEAAGGGGPARSAVMFKLVAPVMPWTLARLKGYAESLKPLAADLVVLIDVGVLHEGANVTHDSRASDADAKQALEDVLGADRVFWFPWTEPTVVGAFPSFEAMLRNMEFEHHPLLKPVSNADETRKGVWISFGWSLSVRDLVITFLERNGLWERYAYVWPMEADVQVLGDYTLGELMAKLEQEDQADVLAWRPLWAPDWDYPRNWWEKYIISGACPDVEWFGFNRHTPGFELIVEQLYSEDTEYVCFSEGLMRLSNRYLRVHATTVRSYVYQFLEGMVHPIALVNKLSVHLMDDQDWIWNRLPPMDNFTPEKAQEEWEHHIAKQPLDGKRQVGLYHMDDKQQYKASLDSTDKHNIR